MSKRRQARRHRSIPPRIDRGCMRSGWCRSWHVGPCQEEVKDLIQASFTSRVLLLNCSVAIQRGPSAAATERNTAWTMSIPNDSTLVVKSENEPSIIETNESEMVLSRMVLSVGGIVSCSAVANMSSSMVLMVGGIVSCSAIANVEGRVRSITVAITCGTTASRWVVIAFGALWSSFSNLIILPNDA
jgi:hypothetical protein